MKIGDLAKSCGCPVETIRYYEKIGLLPAVFREPNGYRRYNASHLKWLQFILRSRELGFSQDQVRRLTELANQSRPSCRRVHELLERHEEEVQAKLDELESRRRALSRLKARCKKGTRLDCPVIDELMN